MLDERFTAPSGWRTGEFVNLATGHKIHYGTVSPDTPRAHVVILPGLSEFTEKYYETARDLLSRGYAVWALDWAYQGRSSRFEKHPMRRHSDGFDTDIEDLQKLIVDHVRPATQQTPLVMIGHSMGGHIGLRYLIQHQGIFKTAAFTAPMLGINDLRKIPAFLQTLIFYAASPFSTTYVPRGRDWHEGIRKSDGSDIFSSDPLRDSLHNHWCRAHPELQIGSPTWRWLYEAVKSCRTLESKLHKIETPLLMAYAGGEKIVDNDAIIHAGAILPHAELLELPGARHEIFMERDETRQHWFSAFDKLCQSADI